MKLLALLPILLLLAADGSAATLTFDQAVALAAGRATAPQPSSLTALRRAKFPNVRVEVTANTSRTLDLFSEGPLEARYATSVVALDYPLWDGGALAARIDATAARLRGTPERGGLDDARFAQLLDAFGELYLVQRQQEIVRPFFDRLTAEADRSAQLLSSGEISNLIATERREAVLAFASRLLELEARRIEAAARVRLLTGLEEEPTVELDVALAAGRPSSVGQQGTAGQRPALQDDVVEATAIAFEQSRARLREVTATAGFRAMLSGFAGVGAAESTFRDITSDGSFGVYGLRIHLSYPLFRGGVGELSIAEARADVERARIARDAALDVARARQAEYGAREETARKRIALMQQSVEASREREESLHRLVAAGVRSESELTHAQGERSRREIELLSAEIERWKVARLLARITGAAAQP